MGILNLSNRLYKTSLMLFLSAFLLTAVGAATADDDVRIRVFTPREDDLTGTDGTRFVVALRFKFPGDLASTGVTLPGLEPEQETADDPQSVIAVDSSLESSEYGANPNFPGLVVLLSNNKSGAGHNLASLFTQLSVSHRKYADEDEEDEEAEGEAGAAGTHVWTSWLVDSVDEFGTVGEIERATLLVAVVEGDAPDVVEDMNEDGKLTRKDLKLMEYKVLSKVKRIKFDVNGF